MKRQRGRNRRNNNQNNANRSMESNGPDVKVRGTAKQIFEKYEVLARDAASSGNRVKAENCRQHAEHYLRIVNATEAAKQAKEEADAERAEQSSDSKNESSDSSEKPDEGKSRRRYPPQVKKSSKSKSDDNADEPKVDGLEVVEISAEPTDVDAAPKKSTSRRKAPSRKSKTEESAPEAAE